MGRHGPITDALRDPFRFHMLLRFEPRAAERQLKSKIEAKFALLDPSLVKFRGSEIFSMLYRPLGGVNPPTSDNTPSSDSNSDPL